MADTGAIVQAVATAVSSVAGAVTAYGPNDVGKAVAAAKKAGKQASKLVEKQFPNWDFGGKKLAQEQGIETRGAWKKARAEAMQMAYDQAYQQVWMTYQEHIEAMTNQINSLDSQSILDNAVMGDTANATIGAIYGDQQTSKGAFGCASVAIVLVVSSVLLLTLI